MKFNDVLLLIDQAEVTPQEHFALVAMFAAVRFMKDEFRGRTVDDIDYSELTQLIDVWPKVGQKITEQSP